MGGISASFFRGSSCACLMEETPFDFNQSKRPHKLDFNAWSPFSPQLHLHNLHKQVFQLHKSSMFTVNIFIMIK